MVYKPPKQIKDLVALSPSGVWLLLTLWPRHNTRIAQATLAREVGWGLSKLQGILKELKEAGAIQVIRYPTGPGRIDVTWDLSRFDGPLSNAQTSQTLVSDVQLCGVPRYIEGPKTSPFPYMVLADVEEMRCVQQGLCARLQAVEARLGVDPPPRRGGLH